MSMEKLTKRIILLNSKVVEPDPDSAVYRLADIENILGSTCDLDRLKELVSADKQGRVQIIPACKGDVCGACQHFQRIKGTRKGNCEIRPTYTSSINCHPWSKEYPFVAPQSRKACKNFAPIGDGCSHEEKAD